MTQHNDIVNHPAHYTSCKSGIECIEIAELLPFCLGNCYKYLHRAGLKGDKLTDLKKSLWYARRAYLNDEKLPKRHGLEYWKLQLIKTHKKRYFNATRPKAYWCILHILEVLC